MMPSLKKSYVNEANVNNEVSKKGKKGDCFIDGVVKLFWINGMW